MSRALIVLGGLIIVGAIIFAVAAYWTETDERETTLQREKEISDAIKDLDARDAPAWRDILLGRE